MTVTALLICFGLTLFFVFWSSTLKASRTSFLTWKELAAKIQPTPNASIKALALDYLEPREMGKGRSHEEIWAMVGGVQGLTRMKQNAKVLVALASYAQRWNHDDSVIVAERMRHDFLALRRAIIGLGLGIACGYGSARVLAYVHEAATSYYLMRERLLALYAKSHSGILPALEEMV